jgi:CheY-like chemotaxis protein
VNKVILVLEDNQDRRKAMLNVFDERLPAYRLLLTDDPAEFIEHVSNHLQDILLVSLDHDLHERPDQSTELTGMQVVDHLVEMPPAFPVLLHTTNRPDGERMRSRLTEHGWRVKWIVPFDGTEWVAADWYPAVKKAVRATARWE